MLRRNKPYIMFKNFYIVCAICDNFLSHIVKIMHEAYYSYMVNLRFEKCSCHSVCNVYFWRFSIFSKNGSDFLTCSIAPKQSKNKFINCLLFIIIFYLCKFFTYVNSAVLCYLKNIIQTKNIYKILYMFVIS